MPTRVFIGKKNRWAVLQRDGFACRYCGARAPDVVLHIDHVIPVSLGGPNEPENLVTACLECNLGKSAHRLDATRPTADALAVQAMVLAKYPEASFTHEGLLMLGRLFAQFSAASIHAVVREAIDGEPTVDDALGRIWEKVATGYRALSDDLNARTLSPEETRRMVIEGMIRAFEKHERTA